MNRFTAKYADRLAGVLSGFDRLVFRGTLRRLSYTAGLRHYLWKRQVLLKDFGAHAAAVTERIKAGCLAAAASCHLPHWYLGSAATSKEEVARKIAQERGVTEGPVCLLSCVEPFMGYDINRNAASKHLELISRYRKCLCYYWYEFHPECGFLHVRLRSWFPFELQVCLNGREWLARQLDRAGLAYERYDNCFAAVEDFASAQALLDAQLRTDWPALLDELAQQVNPYCNELFGDFCPGYYWTTHQSEWATDLIFTDPQALRLYPLLVRHGMTTWKGKRVRALQPFAPADMALLEAVSRGEFTVNGLRNRGLRALLYGEESGATRDDVRRRAGWVTGQLRLLRVHGLLLM